jgi:hypothetical protein
MATPLLTHRRLQTQMVATGLKPLAKARGGKTLLRGANKRPERRVGRAPKVAAPLEHQKINFILPWTANCHRTVTAFRLGLNFDGHTVIIEGDVSVAHAHKRVSTQKKSKCQDACCGSAAQERRRCRLRQVQNARHDGRWNRASRNNLLLVILSLFFAKPTTKKLDDMPNRRFFETKIGVPGIDH